MKKSLQKLSVFVPFAKGIPSGVAKIRTFKTASQIDKSFSSVSTLTGV